MSLSALIFIGSILLVLTVLQLLILKRTSLALSVILLLILHSATVWTLIHFSSLSEIQYGHFLLLPSLAFSLVGYALGSGRQKKGSIWEVVFPAKGKDVHLDLIRGLAIFGAAGFGKTKSAFAPIIQHCADQRMAGIFYDYKDFELSEMINAFYQKTAHPVYFVAPGRPALSHRINPIHPDYLKSLNDVNALAHAFISNLSYNQRDHTSFFNDAAEAALAGTIWRTKESYPELCNLPYVTAILLTKQLDELEAYLRESEYASILAKTFLDSLASDRQIAAVQATLSNALRKIVSPEMFAVFSGNDFSLALNDTAHPAVMVLVNHPKYDAVFAPFLATVAQSALLQMAERNRHPSVLLLDEAATLKIPRMERVPATMRSYQIATVLGLQDKVQGEILYEEKKLKAILANLSSKLISHANDPDTARYYERFFEVVNQETRSVSRSTSFLTNSSSRETLSTKERSKHKAFEFFKLKPGEFFIFDHEGNNRKAQLKMVDYEPIMPPVIHQESSADMEERFQRVLREARELG
ncbi:MAG: type IV secretion system DNA-binding domain-containing protein [Bacteroidota bacterium]